MTLLRRAHVHRLYPTSEQAEALGRWVGAVRATYNVALEQRRIFWKPGRQFNFASQCREVTALRAEFDWVRDVPVQPLQQAMKDLERAYQNWWAGRAGAPSPRKRGINDAMRFPSAGRFEFRRLSRRLGEVKLPKMGWVRLRWDRAIPGEVKSITVYRRAGIWTVAAQYEQEFAEPVPSTLPAAGIDRGVVVFAALSDGTLIPPSNHGKTALRSLARAQRKLARKKRGSNNRRKQVRRIARLHMRVANARKDVLHKISAGIAKNHGVVVLEKLQVRNMVRSAVGTVEKPGQNVRAKSGLNRSILDQGWGMFARFLGYKLIEQGGRLIEVPPHNTSRTCGECGVVASDSRSGQSFRCVACGHQAHADTSAAIEILRRGTAWTPAEGSGCAPCEAGTGRSAA